MANCIIGENKLIELNISMGSICYKLVKVDPGRFIMGGTSTFDSPEKIVQIDKAFYIGKYPVISISFKSLEFDTFQKSISKLVSVFSEVAEKFSFLLDKNSEASRHTEVITQIFQLADGKLPLFTSTGSITPEANTLITSFLRKMTVLLNRFYGRNTVVIIDESGIKAHTGSV